MPEEEDDDEKKGKDKKGGKDDKKDDKKDKKGGKDDKKDKDKGGKDKGGKEKSPKTPKSPGKGSTKGSAKGSVKGSPKSDKRVEESSDRKIEKSEKSERSDKSEKSERVERPDKPKEKPKRPALGAYKAPPPSETMLRAMAEPGPVYAERFYNDEYEDEQEGQNYVEVQMYQRRSATNISEGEGGGHGMGGGARGQTFYVDVPPPRPPRPPAFDEYYVDEQPPPPPRRERSERLERPNITQQSVFYDESCGGGALQRHRQDGYFDYSEPVGPVGSVPRLEPPPQSRRPIVLPPTTVVVNLSESGAPPPPAGPPARPGGYERQLATGASMRSHEEFRHQQSDMQVRSAPMTTQLTQQLRDIALQHQRPMDDNVISSTERVIYEVIRKMESTSSETSEDRPPGTILRNQAAGGMSPMSPQRPAMSPPQRAIMSPPGMMSPGMVRGPPMRMGMIRSPISAGSRGYLVRTPSGPLRVATPGMPVQYPQRWGPPSRGTPLTPGGRSRATPLTPGGRSRRRDDGMTLFPERSLIMLLVFLFLFVLVVVILAISGMSFPGFSKSKDRYA
ncbi:uncharacterized protein [Dermacentor andersoni]|uniref:uncharacterized protein n=1 Tax=Dermacentor andersoni TaxID=34620 RepID=UPI003B3AF480